MASYKHRDPVDYDPSAVDRSPSKPIRTDGTEYYSDILDRVNGFSGSSLEDLYNSVVGTNITGNNLDTEQREDLIKSIIDKIIAKNELVEQRNYDKPTAVLERLLAAGMSKDAALQVIAGGAGSSASGGSALIGAGAAPAPSESYANEVAAKTNIANSIFNGFQCAASLADFGIRIPGQIANNTIAQVSAKATTQAQMALQGINTGINALNACVDAGLIDRDTADAASRGSHTLDNALQYCAKKDPNSAAAQFMQTPAYAELSQNPFAAQVASDRYMRARSADDYAVNMAHNMRMQMGAEILQSTNIDIAATELTKLINDNEGVVLDNFLRYYNLTEVSPAQVREIYSRIGLNESTVKLNNGNLSLIPYQKRVYNSQVRVNNSLVNANNAQAEVARANARVLNLQGDRLQIDNNLFKGALNTFVSSKDSPWGTKMTGGDLVKTSMFYNFYQNALTLSCFGDTKYGQQYLSALYSNAEFNAVNAMTRSLYATDFLSEYTHSNDLQQFMRGLQWTFYDPISRNSNFGAAAGSAVDAAGTAATILKFIPK